MKILTKLALVSAISLGSIYVAGCGSMDTPYATYSQKPGFDGNEQNSGIVQFLSDGSLEITPCAWTRYNFFIEKYGDRLVPPSKKNAGCTQLPSGNWKMTKEAAFNWFKMIEMAKMDEINGGNSK